MTKPATQTPKTGPDTQGTTAASSHVPNTPTLSAAFARHDQMTADMDDTQAMIDQESARLESSVSSVNTAKKALSDLHERLANKLKIGTDGHQGPWDNYQEQLDYINANPDYVKAKQDLEQQEQLQEEIESRKAALIKTWHQQKQTRAEIRRESGSLEEIREEVSRLNSLEEEADTISNLLETKLDLLQEQPPDDDSQARRSVLLASVALGEPGASAELDALDKAIAIRSAAKVAENQRRSETEQLVRGLEAKLQAKQAEIRSLRKRVRLALHWHLENEREAGQKRFDSLAAEMHTAHLRLAALSHLTGSDRNTLVAFLNLPGHTDTWDARAAQRQQEIDHLSELGILPSLDLIPTGSDL